jgi:hypothetical protein
MYKVNKVIQLAFFRIKSAFRDLLPIILVIAFFQIFIFRQPLPDLPDVLLGTVLVAIGLSFFIQGLEMALFPLGESLAFALAGKGSFLWLMIFSFFLGFSTTIAEPALIAVSAEASNIASQGGFIESTDSSRSNYAMGLRLSVAVAVGIAIMVGVLRILKGWPIQYLIIGGYVIIMAMTPFAPAEIVGVAYDAGGVTTSTVTVPLVTALGVGLSTIIRGRNPLLDGFGLIAFASLFPMIFVMMYGMII